MFMCTSRSRGDGENVKVRIARLLTPKTLACLRIESESGSGFDGISKRWKGFLGRVSMNKGCAEEQQGMWDGHQPSWVGGGVRVLATRDNGEAKARRGKGGGRSVWSRMQCASPPP